MDNMDLLKLIVFEACEDGRVDDFDKNDMLNFIEEAVKLQDKKEHDKILSANKKENLRDNDIKREYAIVVRIDVPNLKIIFDFEDYEYGIINNKNISKKSALQNRVNKCRRAGLYSFGCNTPAEARDMVSKLTKEYNASPNGNNVNDYHWAQKVAKIKNKCSIMSPEFKKDCDQFISNYR